MTRKLEASSWKLGVGTLVVLAVQVFGLWRCPAPPVELRKATQGEVNAGAAVNAYVGPAELNAWTGAGGGPTNGQTQAQVQAIVANTNNNIALPAINKKANTNAPTIFNLTAAQTLFTTNVNGVANANGNDHLYFKTTNGAINIVPSIDFNVLAGGQASMTSENGNSGIQSGINGNVTISADQGNLHGGNITLQSPGGVAITGTVSAPAAKFNMITNNGVGPGQLLGDWAVTGTLDVLDVFSFENGVLGNGSGLTNLQAANVVGLAVITNPQPNTIAGWDAGTNLTSWQDAITLTNQQFPESVVAVKTQATNYTLNVASTRKQKIFTGNTNANFTFSNIATNKELDVYVDALTSSVPCIVTWPAHVVLNHYALLTVTNGQSYYYHIDFWDGTDPTNAVIMGGDYLQRQ